MPAGRRPLRSTVYLEIALRELPPDAPVRVLYPSWRELHRRTVGYELYDAKRSFRAALDVARRRLSKQRG